ncbi:DNA-processing protein DprA [Thalassobacillus devorans]|uniref:DNA-processing protein DprA n=1 Tax=Thalassobacillus devorans TaxID=279813 RepID=UPI000A1CC894|nr:DNA-processing protein DprA [Thalassobacillus devorans]
MNDPRRKLLIFLHNNDYATRPLLRRILLHDPGLTSVFHMSSQDISSLYNIPFQRAKAFHDQLQSDARRYKSEQFMKEFSVITIFDEDYPILLKNIPDPPFVLYLAGNRELLNHTPSISVVGTRKPTKSAYPAMERVISPLIEAGWRVVSGLAAGVDRFAHLLALRYHGTTVGVIGSGFHHIYPKENISLFQQMAASQLVISEYAPDVRPQKYHFPERNRIVSGLSAATLVVEAKARSGSLITVDQALEQGREVFAFPGSLLNENSEGCNRMIQEGAKMVLNTHDIIESWPK